MGLDQETPGAVLICVENRRLENPDDHAISAWGKVKSGWKAGRTVRSVDDASMEGPVALAAKAEEAGLFENMADFDDHFEDVSLDPRNLDVTQALLELS